MASIFEQTLVPKIDFSNFDLSESNLLTCNFGQLIPCYVREVLPNDVFTLGGACQVNFAPMVAPMYQDVHASIHFFYAPDRILFDDFEQFITGSVEGYALSEDQIPVQPGMSLSEIDALSDEVQSFSSWQGSVLDYFGLPSDLSTQNQGTGAEDWYDSTIISDFPLRAYFKIWFDYYRDENLQAEYIDDQGDKQLLFEAWRSWRRVSDPLTEFSTSDFMTIVNYMKPRYRAYRKDYFTACLQQPQKGEPVSLSLSTSAPVTFPNQVFLGAPGGKTPLDPAIIANFDNSNTNPGDAVSVSDVVTPSLNQHYLDAGEQGNYLKGFISGLYTDISQQTPLTGTADLSAATAITVEQLREAFAVQEILESLSMRGSRYTEFLKGNFGVTPDDYKLQRPQFLGGLVTPVQVQQVLQQSGYSGQDSRDMTGYAAGRAFASVGGRVFKQRFKEHGYIIGILSIMPKAYYYQGIPRHFMRKDRFDYYLPQTAHLGEQGVPKYELFYDSAQAQLNETVFGFIPRWAEYKTSTNGIHGDFRGNLNYYHMARTFTSLSSPTLSEDFILTKNVPTRPFAVWQTENPNIDHLCWVNCFFKVIASRPMPYHSIPKVL